MPPSGYPRRDADRIAAFLSACADALESECSIKECDLARGLRDEIAGIDSVLAKHETELFAYHTLLLTRAFYARILAQNPVSLGDYRAGVEAILDEVRSEITGVHVEQFAK